MNEQRTNRDNAQGMMTLSIPVKTSTYDVLWRLAPVRMGVKMDAETFAVEIIERKAKRLLIREAMGKLM